MCNAYRLRLDAASLFEAFAATGGELAAPEGVPNIEARDDVRITDTAPIVRAGAAGAELVQRRWSWPGGGGRPVYNFRSEGRDFGAAERCLIPADGFYEFTEPPMRKARKDKWLFTLIGEPVFAIAGIWRADRNVGEAFTMLTTEPGPDVAPYHARQIVVLPRRLWSAWLFEGAREVLAPLPGGSLAAEQIR